MKKNKIIAALCIVATLMSACNRVEVLTDTTTYTSADSTLPPVTDESCATESTDATDITDITDNTDISDTTDITGDIDVPDEVDPDATFTLTFGGDTALDTFYGELGNGALVWGGIEYPFRDVKPIFENSDYTIINLETAVGTEGESEKRYGFGFLTPPEALESFTWAGIDMMNLANNHTRDFGVEGVELTLSHLKEYGLEYVGAGMNLDESRECKIVEKNGIKVGFLAFNLFVSSEGWLAEDDKAGQSAWTADMYSEYLADIKKYDSEVDFLVVSAHWGVEETYELTSSQQSMARLFADNGADLVIGHHPHVVQGIEYYNGVPIFYSVGNLLFYKLEDMLDGISGVFEVTFHKNGVIDARIYPVFIGSCRVQLLTEDDEKYNHVLSALGMCSLPFDVGVDNTGKIIFNYYGNEPILEPVELVEIDLEGIRNESNQENAEENE